MTSSCKTSSSDQTRTRQSRDTHTHLAHELEVRGTEEPDQRKTDLFMVNNEQRMKCGKREATVDMGRESFLAGNFSETL